MIDPDEQARIFATYFLCFVLLCLIVAALVSCAARPALGHIPNCPGAPGIEKKPGCYFINGPSNTLEECCGGKTWNYHCGPEVNGRPSPK